MVIPRLRSAFEFLRRHADAPGSVLSVFGRYALGVSITAIALAARFALADVLPSSGFPFLSFFPAVLLTAFVAGLGPGLLASGLSVLAAAYWFMGVHGGFGGIGRADAVALVFFSAVLLVDCVVIHIMNQALARARRAQLQVRQSERRLRLVLDRLFVYVALLDVDGTLQEINQAPLASRGLLREHVIGHKLWATPWWSEHPERRRALVDAVARAARGETVRYDLQVEHDNGEAVVLDFQIAPLRDDDQRIVGLVASGVDITSRVLAMADLEQSRAQALTAAAAAERERRLLDATFLTAPAGIIVAGADGRLLRMNRANERIWGAAPYSRNIEGYAAWKGWWAGDSPRAGQRIEPHEWGLARSLEHGEECNDVVEIEPFDQPGRRLVTLLCSAPVRDPDGRIVGGVVVQVDVTQRIQAERALREADRKKDTFLATLSHELRNPLAPIRAAVKVLGMSAPQGPRAARSIAVIERQSAQLTRLVDDLLDVSRLNFGNLSLQRERVDLRRIVEIAVETSQPALEAGDQQLDLHLPETAIMVDADVTRMVQCVANLMNNACKFTPRQGRIEVEARQVDDRWAWVQVRDTGQGIAPEMLAQVFDLFAQERRSGMGGNTGLGIGLALTRRLVELHDGQVQALSEGPGRGAQFEIRLPLAAQPAPQPPAPVEPPLAGDALSVLVVDDNIDAAETLQLLLQMQGFHVTMANDGATALAQARQHRPQVIVLDIGLPDMTGYDVARAIRNDPGWTFRPLLVALTGWGQAKDRARALDAGFDHHLTKPADPDRLAAILQERLQPA